METLSQLLKNTTVEAIAPKPSEVVAVDSNDTVLDALKSLIEGGIISAPVINKEKKECVGLIDVLDILAFTVELFEEVEQKGATIFTRLATGGKFAKQKVSGITDFAHNPYTPMSKGESVYDACKLFVSKSSHRCPILEPSSNQISSILTQSAVVNLIASKPGCLGDLGKKMIKDLNLGTKPVITVNKQVRTIDAFKKMHENRVSGLGVVDGNNKLIGNLSARDLKAIDPQNIYSSMFISTNAFVQKIRQDSIQEVHPAISCSDNTTLEFLIGRLAANRIHRVYVCQDFVPVKIISLRDVIKCLLQNIDK